MSMHQVMLGTPWYYLTEDKPLEEEGDNLEITNIHLMISIVNFIFDALYTLI
jgi:hypothetical protein